SEAARLEALRQYAILDTAPEEAYDELAELAAHVTGAAVAAIGFMDEKRQWFKARVGITSNGVPRETSICQHALGQDDLFVVSDASQDERFASLPSVVGEPYVRFYAGAPLLTPDGQTLGTLCVLDRIPRVLDAAQRLSLRLIARQVMALLELRRSAAGLQNAQELDQVAIRNLEGILDEVP